MDYEKCETYQIKGPDGLCIGGDDGCETCPLYIRWKEIEAKEESEKRKGQY